MSEGKSMQLTAKDSDLDWSKGMDLLFVKQPYTGTKLVHEWTWKHDNWNVEWIGVHGSKGVYINGTIVKVMSNGRFVLTNKQTKEQVVMILTRLGRIRMAAYPL